MYRSLAGYLGFAWSVVICMLMAMLWPLYVTQEPSRSRLLPLPASFSNLVSRPRTSQSDFAQRIAFSLSGLARQERAYTQPPVCTPTANALSPRPGYTRTTKHESKPLEGCTPSCSARGRRRVSRSRSFAAWKDLASGRGMPHRPKSMGLNGTAELPRLLCSRRFRTPPAACIRLLRSPRCCSVSLPHWASSIAGTRDHLSMTSRIQ